MSAQPIRLTIVVSHPIQYFVPVYRELAKEPSILLTVLFASRVGVEAYYDPGFGQQVQWDIPMTDGYHSVFLSPRRKTGGLQWRIISELMRHRPDVVLFHGYNQPTNLLGILVAKVLGKKVMMRGDTRLSLRNTKQNLKYQFKKWLFNRIDGFVTIGTLNEKYYRHYGVPENKLYFAPFCVDNRLFDPGASAFVERTRVREELSIPESKRIILFVAKLTERKHPHDLLTAFTNIHARHPDTVLVFAGSGEQEHSLRREAEKKNLDVRFLGFVNQTLLPGLYAASDIFVLPSANEPWGLVINEALAAGLPAITTDDVGAAPDLIIGKATGQVYAAGDVQALTTVLDDWLSNPEKIMEMAKNAKSLIQQWDVEHCAKGIASAALKVRAGLKA